MGQPTGYAELRQRVLRGAGRARPRARRPGAARRRCSTSSPTRIAPAHAEQLPPARAQLLHAAAAGRLDRRRGPRPVDEPGRRRLARGSGRPRSSRRRSSAGCATSSGTARAASGCCASGGVMANFIALALVRDVHLRRADRAPTGRRGAPRSRASASTRATRPTSRSPAPSTSWASRPRPSRSCRPTTRFRLHAAPVAEAIARDRAAGVRPDRHRAPSRARPTRARWTSSRSSPPSPQREGLWLHVDAAYGGAARLSARDADRVPGLHLADSVTIDPHKWFFQAYDVGALLVRDGGQLRAGLRPVARVLPRRRGRGGRRGRRP